MARKAIPETTQSNVLLKSRRRCCMCFWLAGRDEVVKGQIAHLDQNHENPVEDNLVFLCYDHHDEYDSRTSTSKGLREGEVRKWRDELYRDMEYRFRTVRRRELRLSVRKLVLVGIYGHFKLDFRLTNTGEVEIRGATVAIRLPDDVPAEVPRRRERVNLGFKRTIEMSLPFDPFGMSESTEDLFEPNGRVGIVSSLPPANPVLLSGHCADFDGLNLDVEQYPLGSELLLDYRIDAEEMQPVTGTLRVPISPESEWDMEDIYEDDLADLSPDDPFGRTLAQIFAAHEPEQEDDEPEE